MGMEAELCGAMAAVCVNVALFVILRLGSKRS